MHTKENKIDTSKLKFPKGKKTKKRKTSSKSILRSCKGICFICGEHGQTEEHHIFGGANRWLSEKYGLKVDLCPECHRTGKTAVHNSSCIMEALHKTGQEAFEEQIGSRTEFRTIFGKNYL